MSLITRIQRSILVWLVAALALNCAATAGAQSAVSASSIGGYWQTFDAKTGHKKSIVKLFVQQGIMFGRIMQVNYAAGKGPKDLCTACSGAQQTQPILGMIFLRGLKLDPETANHWIGGTLLDPQTGDSYSVQLTLGSNENVLNVLVYKGSTVLGRTQVWHRSSAHALTAFPTNMVAAGPDSAALAFL